MASDEAGRALIERVVARPVADATRAAWGFTNRTDLVTLEGGERVVVQRYRRREDAAYRLRVMQALLSPAAAAGIAIPRVRDAGLDDDPPWVVFDALPGAPVFEAGDEAVIALARPMGELLAAFRGLPADGLELDDLWAAPGDLAACATDWADEFPGLAAGERAALTDLVTRVPALFAGRPAVLAHGDFAPVNVLTDGSSVTGLLDFEAVRLADPLFDVAWWAWAVSFTSSGVLDAAWPEFLRGAGVDAADPALPARVRALQVLRMLELLADETTLEPGIQRVVADRLRTTLR